MRSGKALSDREKEFIEKNFKGKINNKPLMYLAKQLGELYPLDNGGSRSHETIRSYIRKGLYMQWCINEPKDFLPCKKAVRGYKGSGKSLSDHEKIYIHANKNCLSLRDIANQLGELYSKDNGGYRERQCVRNEAKKTKIQPFKKRDRDAKGRFMKLQDKSGVG